jgi:hypothetical protein
MNGNFSYFNQMYGGGNQSSKLLDLLKNENSTLDEVLDEDALSQDFRDSKPHVVN